MGCPLCNWKTAGLLIAGLIMLFLPGFLSYIGMGLIAVAYGMALMPGKTCKVDYSKNVNSGRIGSNISDNITDNTNDEIIADNTNDEIIADNTLDKMTNIKDPEKEV